MNFKLKKSGFTLSEVMVTLALVGTLATLTISTVGASVQQRARLSEFRAAYAKITAALKSIEFDRGSVYACYTGANLSEDIISAYGLNRDSVAPTSNSECARFIRDFTKALGAVRSCDGSNKNTPVEGGCVPNDYPKEVCGWDFFNASQAYVFDNGMILMNRYMPNSANFPQAFALDVNGRKGPNKWGQDLFVFALVVAETKDVNGSEYVKDVRFIEPNIQDNQCTLGASGKSTRQMIKESAGVK